MFDRCLYFNTNHLSRVVTKLSNDAYKHLDLSASHAYLLRLVLQQPGLLQKEIGELLYLEKSTITRFINKMVNQGYLLRKPLIIEETKYQYIYATNKLEIIASELENIGTEFYERMVKIISVDELSRLVNNIKDVTNKL